MRILLALLGLALGANAAADPRLDQAAREGEVSWYTTMNVADIEEVLQPFRARYPFLRLDIQRDTAENVRNSILREARDNRFSWDVVSMSLFDLDVLNRAGQLAAYVSPETQSGFAPGAVDRGGRWTALYARYYVIGYNTRLVRPGTAPPDWPELLSPLWTGRIAIDEGDAEWYAGMLEYWGRKPGVDYMRALARQKPQRLRGHTPLMRRLVSGRVPLAIVYASEVEREKRAGAAVDWVTTLDPTVASPTQVAISARAPHPAAARLLVDYLLSKDGQRAIRARGRVPARNDLGGSPGQAPRKVYYVDPRLAAKLDDYEREFRAVMLRAR